MTFDLGWIISNPAWGFLWLFYVTPDKCTLWYLG